MPAGSVVKPLSAVIPNRTLEMVDFISWFSICTFILKKDLTDTYLGS